MKFANNPLVIIGLVLLAAVLLFDRFIKKMPDAVCVVLLIIICIVIVVGMVISRNK